MNFNGRMAGHDAQDLIAEPVHLPALSLYLDFVKDIEEQLFVVSAGQKGRHALIIKVPAPKSSTTSPSRFIS